MHIADSYIAEKDYAAAVEAYQAARKKIGHGGWHKDHIERNLKKAEELAGRGND